MEKQVFIILAEGFEEIEAVAPADILKRLGCSVTLVGLNSRTVSGAHGIRVEADSLLTETCFEQADAIVLPGGLPGATNLRDDAAVIELLRKQDRAGKICAAICAAPAVLEFAGIVRGRTVTGYPGCEKLSGSATLQFTGRPSERCENLVTGRGPGAAFDFGCELAAALGYSPEETGNLMKGMLVNA